MISPLPPGGHKIRCGRVMVLPLVPIAAATPQTWHLTLLEPAPFEQTEICQEIVTLPCGIRAWNCLCRPGAGSTASVDLNKRGSQHKGGPKAQTEFVTLPPEVSLLNGPPLYVDICVSTVY